MYIYFKDGKPVIVLDWLDRVERFSEILIESWPAKVIAKAVKVLRRKNPLQAKRILIFSNLHLGDGIMQTPQIKLVRDKFPDAEIGVVASHRNKEVFIHNPYIDSIVLYPVVRLGGFSIQKRIKMFLDFAKAIYKSDLCILTIWMHGLRSKIFARFLGTRYIISESYQSPYGAALLDEVISVDTRAHHVDQYLQLIQNSTLGTISVKSVDTQPIMYLSGAKTRKAKEYCIKIGLKKENIIIGIHMGAASTGRTKCWSAGKYFGLVTLIADNYSNTQFILFKGPDEHNINLEPFKSLNCYVVENVSFLESVAILGETDLFIGNDSSLGHAAAALNLPVISIFGPTSYRQYRPYGEKVYVIRSAIDHAPCHENKNYYKYCEGKIDCLTNLTVETVFAVVDDKLKRHVHAKIKEPALPEKGI